MNSWNEVKERRKEEMKEGRKEGLKEGKREGTTSPFHCHLNEVLQGELRHPRAHALYGAVHHEDLAMQNMERGRDGYVEGCWF